MKNNLSIGSRQQKSWKLRATILGAAVLAAAVGLRVLKRLESETLNSMERYALRGFSEVEKRELALKQNLAHIADLAKPEFGLSGCLEAGQILNVRGVKGTACAGIGFGGNILPNFKERGAGVSVNFTF